MAQKKNDDKVNFEKSLGRLEEIVEQMESGTLGLEEMMKSFEEGIALVKSCSKKLNEVEKKIEILVKKEGDIVAAPFDKADALAESAGHES